MSAVRGRGSADPPFPGESTAVARELGRGRLVEGLPNGRPQRILHLDATDAPPSLIGRLLVGSYITGQDQVVVTGRGGLSPAHRSEIHRVVDRLLGMTVVDDRPSAIEIQNFVDPGKYELPRLLHRVVEMLQDELVSCHDALTGRRPASLEALDLIEEEVDRLYLLMARQLLLSSEDSRVAHDIDVESHHYQIGYRLVAKALEVTGDLIHGIGTELRQNLVGLRRMPEALGQELALRIRRLGDVLGRTMSAFVSLSVLDADATLNRISEALRTDACLGQLIARSTPERPVAVSAQRIVCNLMMGLEMLVIVNEVTINRSVEPEPATRGGSRVSLVVPRESRSRPTPSA